MDLPHLESGELAVLQQSHASLSALTIHQISDVKDILQRLDVSAFPGISLWKKSVERAMYDCDSVQYQKLVDLISPSNV